MENSKQSSGEERPNCENPNLESETEVVEPNPNLSSSVPNSRTPFTSLSQIDADLALARTLQEQERAYMILSRGFGNGSEYDSSESVSYVYEDEDEDDDEDTESNGDNEPNDADTHVNDANIDPSAFESDEAYARALQEAEERAMVVRMMALAGINGQVEDPVDHGNNSQVTWQDVDPDELQYEELLALGEVVGNESKGLSADLIASLPSSVYKVQSAADSDTDQCVICRLEYEDGDALVLLPCKHAYHSDCINSWLQINKVCPMCSAEVSNLNDKQGSANSNTSDPSLL